MVDAFRMHVLQTKEAGLVPIRMVGNCSCLYMRVSNVYIVTVVSTNANAALAFKFVVEVREREGLKWSRIQEVATSVKKGVGERGN